MEGNGKEAALSRARNIARRHPGGEQIVNMYEKYLEVESARKAAMLFGFSQTTLLNILRRFSLPRFNAGGGEKQRHIVLRDVTEW